ncbi:hypothetical protein EI94DRAFT_1748908 [Lactarius quietus]|nr:hypothetical protein EI94DRAFT_1748908 [Lactarius quietus]
MTGFRSMRWRSTREAYARLRCPPARAQNPSGSDCCHRLYSTNSHRISQIGRRSSLTPPSRWKVISLTVTVCRS